MSKNTTYTVSIDRDKAGKRLDRVLADALPILSRSRIKVLMQNGHVSHGDGNLVTAADMAYTLNRFIELPTSKNYFRRIT